MGSLPTGTVTFLFTDIQGSTNLARANPETWEAARQRHNCIVQSAIESNHGFVFQCIGDSICSAFDTPGKAVRAALSAQRVLQSETWGNAVIRVRMGIHTGAAETDGKDYRGYLTLSLVQRVTSAGHGGQILISSATEALLRSDLPEGISFLDLGEHRLKDSAGPVRLFQVVAPGIRTDFPAPRALDVFPNNLPAHLTRLIGREKEIAEVGRALAENRLVTLTGPGGAGKTRLALEVGIAYVENARTIGNYPNGVYFVSLAPLEAAEAIVPTIATALGFSFYEGSEPRAQLLNYLREKSLFLILDNFEHLLSGVGLLNEILTTAPEVKILVTSRTRLNIQGEQIFHLGGMDFPAWETSEDVAGYGAVKLFLESGRRVRQESAFTSDELKYVVRICHLVEGMPLGILLAASWLEMLAPKEIAEEIERSLDFLETQQRDLPDRQRSMRAVFDYSWQLLTPSEQETFKRSSVFRGGFSRETAQMVTGASLRDLMGLVDKSLLQRHRNGRYGIHELIRQYAADKLAYVPEDEQAARDLHSAYYAEFLRQREALLFGREQRAAMSEIEAEIENIRAGWEWAVEHVQVGRLADYLESVGELYETRGWSREGFNLFARAMQRVSAVPGPEHDRVTQLLQGRLLLWQGILSTYFDTSDSSNRCLRASVAKFRELGADREMAYALTYHGALMAEHADEAVDASCQDALRIFKEAGDQRGVALALIGMARAAFEHGEFMSAKQQYQESVNLFRELGDQKHTARSLDGLGYICWILGEYQQARQYHEEVLGLSQEIGDQSGISGALNSLGIDMYAAGDYGKSGEFWQASIAAHRKIGDSRGMSVDLGNLGELALATGEYAQAAQFAKESLILLTKAGGRHYAWSLRVLGNAELGMGELLLAQTYLQQALQEAMGVRDWGQLLLTLVGVAELYTEQGKEEHALELLPLIMNHPASWQLAKDQALPVMTKLEAELPADIVLAAKKRGCARELKTTVAQLLDEMNESA